MRLTSPRLRACFAVMLLMCVSWVAQASPQVQTIWQLLDYIAVDYGAAVQDGQVVSEMEFQEMQEFSATVRERLAQLPEHPARDGLVARAGDLEQAISAKSAPAEVDRQARALADALLQAYPVPRGPETTPDLAGAPAPYQQTSASCHGPTRHGDGPAAAGPRPARRAPAVPRDVRERPRPPRPRRRPGRGRARAAADRLHRRRARAPAQRVRAAPGDHPGPGRHVHGQLRAPVGRTALG